MCKNKLFVSFFCLLWVQTSCHKNFYDPITIIHDRHQYLESLIINKFKIDTSNTDVYFFSNTFDKNEDIIKYLNETISYGMLNRYFTVASKESIVKPSKHPIGKQKACIISGSLPVYDITKEQICFMVEISSFSESNWIGKADFYFVFDRLNHVDKLSYVSHVRSNIQTNVGPPVYLPDLKSIDTLNIDSKMRHIDSILKSNHNKIPDSLKVNMGIKGN